MLASLLAELPRLKKDLPGWSEGQLVPVLAAFRDDATDAQIATAFETLRKVLRQRADIDPWLGDIADLGRGEYTDLDRAMTPAAKLPRRAELVPHPPTNRTIVEQARQLRDALTRTTKDQNRTTSPPQPKLGPQ
jgi:hypothetical protein